MTDSAPESPLCLIEDALGRTELCPEESCPFWNAGDNIRLGGCAFEQVDLSGRGDLAQLLHDLRGQLGTARPESEAEARRVFYERLNAGRSD